ncbi:MAG TPA: MFS transporter [Acidimicrobiales bacterium]|nr:MFS transporter [Acidimicrobiales bacterium]
MRVRNPEVGTRVGGAALAGVFLLAAFNLRPALASISPILPTIRAADRLSPAAAGVLTTMPLVCFGGVAFSAPRLAHRRGAGSVVVVCLVALAAGIALRSAPALPALFGGTFVIGMSIGICNVLMPGILKRDFPARVALMMGLYTTMLSLGPSAGSGITIPLEHALGGSWRLALSAWAVVSAVAALCWLPFRHRDTAASPPDAPVSAFRRHGLWRRGSAWSISLYMGLQALNFYTVLTWLPTILQSKGTSALGAGTLLAVVSGVGTGAALLTPTLSQRIGSLWAIGAGAAVANAAGTAGLLLDGRHLQVLWSVFFGLAQGSSISTALMLMVVKARDSAEANALSGMAQGVGYLIAAGGPVLAGALFDVSGGWSVPLAALFVCQALQVATVWWADRPLTGDNGAALATLEPWL